MQRALHIAQLGRYTARPNPCVGAVIVKDNRIVGEGYHEYCGGPHAEVNALNQAGHQAQGATLYVTLEPCAHHGKTPPCVDAVIQAGIKRVVIASCDPNPLVNGQGVKKLLQAELSVQTGVLALNSVALNRAFMHRMRTNRPYVIAKTGMSLDGKIAMHTGESQWITGVQSRQVVQSLRADSCAIVTGSQTVLNDDARLTVRDKTITSRPHFRQPLRVLLDARGRVTNEAQFFNEPGETWHVQAPIEPVELLEQLGAKHCNQVMLEAGSETLTRFLKAGCVDEWHVFVAPSLLGNQTLPCVKWDVHTLAERFQLRVKQVSTVGEDVYVQFVPSHRESAQRPRHCEGQSPEAISGRLLRPNGPRNDEIIKEVNKCSQA